MLIFSFDKYIAQEHFLTSSVWSQIMKVLIHRRHIWSELYCSIAALLQYCPKNKPTQKDRMTALEWMGIWGNNLSRFPNDLDWKTSNEQTRWWWHWLEKMLDRSTALDRTNCPSKTKQPSEVWHNGKKQIQELSFTEHVSHFHSNQKFESDKKEKKWKISGRDFSQNCFLNE